MQWRSSRRMRDKKRQNGVVKLPRLHLGQEMTAARKELDLRPRYQTCKFHGEIGRGDEIIFGTDDQSRRLDAPKLTRAVKRQHRVDPARNYLHRRKGREVLSLGLAQPFIVATNPPTRVEEQRR